MTNTINNNVVYCTNDEINYFISRDRGKSWQPVKDDRFVVRRVNGVITHGYVSPPSYIPEFASPDTFTHSSYSTTYPFAPFIKCNKNLPYDFEANLNDLRALMFNNGARFVWDRRVRLAYDARLKEMADYYKKQIALGKMTPEEAGWSSFNMRNKNLKDLRNWTHSIGLKKARMRKGDKGMSKANALKNSIANFEAKPYLPKNFSELPQTEQDKIRRPIVKKIKESYNKNPSKMHDIFKKNKAGVFNEMIEAAGRADSAVTSKFLNPKGLSLVELRLLHMSIAISAFNVLFADDPTTALIYELASDFVIFVGGFVGGGIGSRTVCIGKGQAGIICVVASSMMGGMIALEEYDHLNGK
ncbi:unnamed protein product [Commensalibacter communis]|uniref:hypothetical protein n=1 Tax=Commensalibacter communis TaxID=2972786 RepID=UPI0022FFB62F|nr:hypothetical protein [Commensalibacter communis]CAI3957482.1 unnamed protein product [Commensalibacter communis]CAI3958782.1 unnamed protein product [Commensalibacter communis]